MRRVTTLEERTLIVELARQGRSDREIAQFLGWSLGVVRKWRRRGQRARPLGSRLGRPPTGALGTFYPQVQETLRNWRRAHPGWGPKILRAELEAVRVIP